MRVTIVQAIFNAAVLTLDVLQRVFMRVFSMVSPSEEVATVFGARMFCESRDFVQRRVRFFRIFEHNLTYYTLSRLRPGDGYADIGANVGYYSLLASRSVGEAGFVVAVEAAPSTFAKLQTNLALNPTANVHPIHAAATADFCTISIQANDPANIGMNTVVIDAAGEVSGRPLMDLLAGRAARTHFIKIDVEGSERPLLVDILANLAAFPDRLTIAAEVSENSTDLVEAFAAAGFRAYVSEPIYTIDYYLMRHYLAWRGHPASYSLTEVSAYVDGQPDYIFERLAA